MTEPFLTPPRQISLPVSIDDLELAFGSGSIEANFYLDLMSGEILTVTEDTRAELEIFCSSAFPDTGIDDIGSDELDAAFDREEVEDWEREVFRAVILMDSGPVDRYLDVPGSDTSEDYATMEAFIETVQNAQLQERLWDAIDGRGAFGRFKSVVGRDESELRRWYAYRDERLRKRIHEWLEAEGITPTPRPAPDVPT